MSTGQPYNGPPQSYLPPPRRGRGPAFWIALLMTALLGISALLNLFFLLALAVTTMPDEGEETIVTEGSREDVRIAIVTLQGAIMDNPLDGSGYSPVEEMRERLEQAAKDDRVKAIVIEINSPGGIVSAFDQIHKMIVDFKTESKKPVVVSMGGIAASGGYYASVAGDYLFAQPTTLTGSIGVIIPRYDLSEGFEYYGIKYDAIKSGKSKDSLSMGKPMGEAQREHLQALVDDAYEKFLQRVGDGRGTKVDIKDEAFRDNAADGRILTADQALSFNLIDEIGYLDDAVAKAEELAGVSDATVVRYTRSPSLLDVLRMGQASTGGGVNIHIDVDNMIVNRTPRLMYLWTEE